MLKQWIRTGSALALLGGGLFISTAAGQEAGIIVHEADRAEAGSEELKDLRHQVARLKDQLREAARRIVRLHKELERDGERAARAEEDLAKARALVKDLSDQANDQEKRAQERSEENLHLRRALQELRAELRSGPALPREAHEHLRDAVALEADDQWEEAARRYREARVQWPDLSPFALGLARCHLHLGRTSSARSLVEDLLELDRNDPEAHVLLGMILFEEGDPKLAERHFDKALDKRPGDDALLVYLGMARYARGRTDSARKAFEDALEANQDNAEAHFNLAILFAEDEDPDWVRARRHYARALRLGSAPDKALTALLRSPGGNEGP